MSEKTYISAEEVQLQSTVLANEIIKLVKVSDFKPTHLISLVRGALAISQYVHGALNRAGIHTKFMTARTESYDNTGNQGKTVAVHGIEWIVKCAKSTDQFLIVDDIFDSGQSVLALITKLKRKMGVDFPGKVKIATIFWKPHKNTTELVPDFFVKATKDWIVFPHEVDELTIDEIEQFMGPKMAALFAEQRIDDAGDTPGATSAVGEQLPPLEDDSIDIAQDVKEAFCTPLFVTGPPLPGKSALLCEALSSAPLHEDFNAVPKSVKRPMRRKLAPQDVFPDYKVPEDIAERLLKDFASFEAEEGSVVLPDGTELVKSVLVKKKEVPPHTTTTDDAARQQIADVTSIVYSPVAATDDIEWD